VTWWDYFELRHAPFSKAVTDEALWLRPASVEVVDELVEAVSERATGAVMVADSGMGKTCVMRAMRHALSDQPVRLTYCHNATLGRRDFYRHICRGLGLNPKATAAAVFNAIGDYVTELSCEQLHPVFVIDEAHLLHQDVLDHLHILVNYEWDSRPLVTLILAGLPELWDRLLLRRNRSLWTRLHTRLRLPDPEPKDTVQYVRHRLALAGVDRELFDSEALALLHEGSGGRLRDIDRLATGALKAAARGKHRVVDRALLVNVAHAHQR